ncbi:PREDICTED: DNA-directed RNA polymerases I and III subunit rpc19 isoform X2 [Nicotiana attenuata]|uniref:DNA-directed RNA polymerases I and III subunit rpc19 isoform X2 n=1 Tax=Nicotiana attenuata TaxID=49451 RepID=UPI000905B625|nr:PREDICTED: DNA-directed RNA polymerases I and III subunit rpc19 isoform X2 [Nicotiana attenuata]
MEHGSFEDPSKATFSFTDEDHTLANAVRFTLNQDPRVTFCGYSIPHPSDARVNIRVQTTVTWYLLLVGGGRYPVEFVEVRASWPGHTVIKKKT